MSNGKIMDFLEKPSLMVQNTKNCYHGKEIVQIVSEINNQLSIFSMEKSLAVICSADSMLQFFLTISLWNQGTNIMFVNPMNGKDYFEMIVKEYHPNYVLMDCDSFEKEYIFGLSKGKEITFLDKKLFIYEEDLNEHMLEAYHGMVFFTSGTTNIPKAVFRTEENLYNDAMSNIETFDIREGDKVLISVPFGHVYGLGSGVIPFALQGAGIFFAPPLVTGKALKRIIEEEGITALVASPTIYEELLIADVDLQNVRLMLSAGSKLRSRLIPEFISKYGKYINNMYGSSETGAIATLYLPESTKVDEKNCGRPQSRIEVSCAGTAVQPDVIKVRSLSLAKGVMKDGQLCTIVDQDGWFEMNDMGYLDESGYIHLTNRKDDMINIGGEKLSARTVEAEIEKIYEEVVVLVENSNDGNVYPAAYIKETSIDSGQLIEALASKLTYRFVPRKIYLVQEFPRNANGKIDRKALRDGKGVKLIYASDING